MNQRAFSLVELSIVLVILGLLVGGILAGQSLIRASELRSFIGAKARYETAIHTFRDRYFARPGDFTNAKSVWPSCTDGTNNPCNGNGDGVVVKGCSANNLMEGPRFWQHLALAGLVEGDFSLFNGVTCSTTYTYGRPGTTTPQLKLGKAGVLYFECPVNSTCTYHKQEHVFRWGEYYSDALERGFLTPEEAWNIDTKLDDGSANKGTVTGINGHTDLAHNDCLLSNAYNLAMPERHCGLVTTAP